MEMEVTDICIDKESDCVIVYPKDVSEDSDHESIPSDNAISESYEHVNGDHDLENLEESSEVKEYQVKECTNENKPTLCNNEKSNGKQDIVSSDLGAGLAAEKVSQDSEKEKDQNNLPLPMNHVTKHAAGNVKTKLTVPQPFALATEKRASCGPRLVGAAADAGNGLNRSLNTNNLQNLTIVKKTQVTVLVETNFPAFIFITYNVAVFLYFWKSFCNSARNVSLI